MNSIARLLVFGQFACIAIILFAGSLDLPLWAWSVFAVGIALLFAAASGLGSHNFTVMPVPRSTNELSDRGIYGVIRHPMYSSVILCGIAVTLGAPTLARWIALVLCCIVLVLKIRFEEKQLTSVHPEYPQMMKGVARLIPFIW